MSFQQHSVDRGVKYTNIYLKGFSVWNKRMEKQSVGDSWCSLFSSSSSGGSGSGSGSGSSSSSSSSSVIVGVGKTSIPTS